MLSLQYVLPRARSSKSRAVVSTLRWTFLPDRARRTPSVMLPMSSFLQFEYYFLNQLFWIPLMSKKHYHRRCYLIKAGNTFYYICRTIKIWLLHSTFTHTLQTANSNHSYKISEAGDSISRFEVRVLNTISCSSF